MEQPLVGCWLVNLCFSVLEQECPSTTMEGTGTALAKELPLPCHECCGVSQG